MYSFAKLFFVEHSEKVNLPNLLSTTIWYLDAPAAEVLMTLVYTDHNPLVFINCMRDKNQRLLKWSHISRKIIHLLMHCLELCDF